MKELSEREIFFSLMLESNRSVSIASGYRFEWSIAFINLYNDKLWVSSFLIDLPVKQLVFVSLVKNAFGWRLRSSCFTLFSGLSFYVLGKLRYLVDIWKNHLKKDSYILSFRFCGFLWSILLSLFNVPRDLIGLFNLKNSSSKLSFFWVLLI